jgi:RecJ-like exonuclease
LAGRKPANPPRQQQGFVTITHKRCPDCEYEGNLNTDGRSRVVSGSQLRGASQYVGLTKASVGCETCAGKGYLEVESGSIESIDPYALKSCNTGVIRET